jgi:bifunctional DNase/RNase
MVALEFDHRPLGYHPGKVMQRMDIYGVSFDLVGKQPIVLLKTAEGNRFLPIWIGHSEAAAILMRIQGASTPRPMTHDLLTDVLGQLDAEITRVAVTELRDNTFFAVITVQQNGSEIEIDSRPSDAIALAVRAEAPIFVADEVIEESAIEFEGEEGEAPDISQMTPEQQAKLREDFKEFLDQVTPDQFAEAPGEDA